MEYALITEDVELDGSPDGVQIDLDVPSCKAVMGAGGYVYEAWNASSSSWVDPASLASFPAVAIVVPTVYCGPHPTDSTKWRFQTANVYQSGGNGNPVRVRLWMAVV